MLTSTPCKFSLFSLSFWSYPGYSRSATPADHGKSQVISFSSKARSIDVIPDQAIQFNTKATQLVLFVNTIDLLHSSFILSLFTICLTPLFLSPCFLTFVSNLQTPISITAHLAISFDWFWSTLVSFFWDFSTSIGCSFFICMEVLLKNDWMGDAIWLLCSIFLNKAWPYLNHWSTIIAWCTTCSIFFFSLFSFLFFYLVGRDTKLSAVGQYYIHTESRIHAHMYTWCRPKFLLVNLPTDPLNAINHKFFNSVLKCRSVVHRGKFFISTFQILEP